LFFTLFILIGFFHNKANNRFPVYLAEQYERPGYEPYPAEAKVVMSPKLVSTHVPSVPIVLGFIFLAGIWVAIWVVATDPPSW
jgi:hypothetical protein